MQIHILAILVGLSVIPMAYADSWDLSEDNTITVSIVDNQYATQERLDHIVYTIISDKQKNDTFAGWNKALYTINGTAPQFKLVNNDADVTITLVNYPSNKVYSGFTTFESTYPGVISKADITIYDIENLSTHQLQMIMRHELGHVLGLGHSKDSADLMHVTIPYYSSFISQSNIDDISYMYE